MPRTVQHILDHGDELAERFEEYDPTPDDERDPEVLLALRRAVLGRSEAERSVQPAVNGAACSRLLLAIDRSAVGDIRRSRSPAVQQPAPSLRVRSEIGLIAPAGRP